VSEDLPKQKQKPPQESLSFEALSRELGDTWQSLTPSEDDTEARSATEPASSQPSSTAFDALEEEPALETRKSGGRRVPRPIPAVPKVSGEMADRLNARVLSASAPKARPMWVESLLTGVAACITFFFFRRAPAFAGVREILYYVVLLVCAGAVFWSGYGFTKSETLLGRRLCLAGLALGILAALGAILSR